MPALVTRSSEPLSHEAITERLLALRSHALIDSSHFAVASVVEIQLSEGDFVYVSGVNVENDEHNRLSLHAEQNAVALASALFGGNIQFSRLWVMGAPEAVIKGSQDALADNLVTPCGHCRQILMSHSLPDATIYSVSINGKFSETLLSTLLPNSFSGRDLGSSQDAASSSAVSAVEPSSTLSTSGFFGQPRMELLQLIDKNVLRAEQVLSPQVIQTYFRLIKPHVVSESFKTSPIEACILKVRDGDHPCHYVPGALLQDVAFITTDAISAAIGAAVTEFGGENLKFEAVHIYGASEKPSQLSGCELAQICRFSNHKTPIVFHTPSGKIIESTFIDCVEAQSDRLLTKAHHAVSHRQQETL